MDQSKNNNCKYQLLMEGEMDKIFIEFIKIHYTKSRSKSVCRKHSHYSIEYIHNFESHLSKENCCSGSRWLICDKDQLKDELIQKIKKTKDLNSVISYPSIEIVLASFFEEITSNNITTNQLDKIIQSGLQKQGCKLKYEHNTKSMQRFCEFLLKKINSGIFEKWRKNIQSLNKRGISNFIEWVEYLERGENG